MQKNLKLPKTILLLRENILKTMHPLGLSSSDCSPWCEKNAKETILYTGCLYSTMQILLSKEKYITLLTADPDRDLMASLASFMVKIKPIYRKFIGVDGGRIIKIVEMALEILERIGIEVGCLKNEPYPGMLLLELGFLEDFKSYSFRVYKYLKEEGVKKIITLDPHVYELMKFVYPKYVPDYDIEVLNILDIILDAAEKGILRFKKSEETITYHDPCHYSKSEYRRIIDEPRRLLKLMGFKIVEPFRSRNLSMCCGGPIETYFSTLAREVAKRRFKELNKTGAKYVSVACPICLTSFLSISKDKSKILDIIELVHEMML